MSGAETAPDATVCASPLNFDAVVAAPGVPVAVIVVFTPDEIGAVIESRRASVSSVHVTDAVPVASVMLVGTLVVPAWLTTVQVTTAPGMAAPFWSLTWTSIALAGAVPTGATCALVDWSAVIISPGVGEVAESLLLHAASMAATAENAAMRARERQGMAYVIDPPLKKDSSLLIGCMRVITRGARASSRKSRFFRGEIRFCAPM